MIGPSMLIKLGLLDREAAEAESRAAKSHIRCSGSNHSICRSIRTAGRIDTPEIVHARGRSGTIHVDQVPDPATAIAVASPLSNLRFSKNSERAVQQSPTDAVVGPPSTSDQPARPRPGVEETSSLASPCPDCGLTGRLLQPNRFVAWCPECQAIYLAGRTRLLCRLPRIWSVDAFAGFLHSGLSATGTGQTDLAFTRFVCERVGVPIEEALPIALAAPPETIPIGRLAVQHRLLSQSDVDWVLHYQQTSTPTRRKLFGEVAVSLGLWPESMLAPLLTCQAERARGFVPALADHLDVSPSDLHRLEQVFFGILPSSPTPEHAPITRLLRPRSAAA